MFGGTGTQGPDRTETMVPKRIRLDDIPNGRQWSQHIFIGILLGTGMQGMQKIILGAFEIHTPVGF